MKIAGVRFRENWKVYDFDASDLGLAVGDQVVVESDRGLGFARVVRLRQAQDAAGEQGASPAEEAPAEKQENAAPSEEKGAAKHLRRIVRKATEEDTAKDRKNRELETEAFKICQELITERELPMKLISVEYSFDASRATFFFFSESRVDFRELVKELAHALKSRIEMRQIGVRDVARTIGGYGPCGRELCCASYLRSFEPVSIRMAKKQEMVLNPAKISGVCGRLLCCLSYEYEFYDDIKKDVAEMRDAAEKEKKEAERRIAEEREAEARRIAEERKRQEEQRQQEARQRQRNGEPVGGKKPERKADAAQDRKAQEQPDQSRRPQQPPQKAEQQPQGGKRKRRRFWRRRKKKQGENPHPPTGEGNPKPQYPNPK